MAGYGEIRTGGHCVSVWRPLGFITRYRHPVFSSQHLGRIEEIMRDIGADFETGMAEFNGEAGHVHLLVTFPPEVALSRWVNSLKGVSSRRLQPGIPRTAALLEGEPAVVRALLGRVRRRRTHHGPAPVHRTAGQGRLISAGVRPPFTTGLKAGALAHIPVATGEGGRKPGCHPLPENLEGIGSDALEERS